MAVTVFARYPGLQPQVYDEVVATLDLDANPPIGAILHLAGECADALQVAEIWRTEQSFEAFHDRFLQALQMRGYLSDRPSRSRRCTTSSRSRWRRSSGPARSLPATYAGAALKERRTLTRLSIRGSRRSCGLDRR